MFYYNLYREGYNFRELDFSDIWDAGSSYSLEMKKEMYGIEIKLEDFDLTKDELDEYLQKCKKFNEAFRDFEHKADNFTFYLFFIILPIVSLVVGLIFYYTSIERYKGMIAGGVCTTTALVLYFFVIPKLFKYICIERVNSLVSKIIGERNYKVESYLSEIEFQFYLRVRDVKKESEKKDKREKKKIEDFIRI
jgi:hypothetical protein